MLLELYKYYSAHIIASLYAENTLTSAHIFGRQFANKFLTLLRAYFEPLCAFILLAFMAVSVILFHTLNIFCLVDNLYVHLIL